MSSPMDNSNHDRDPSTSLIALTRAQIEEAFSQSPDNGSTLDLTHLDLQSVSEAAIQLLTTRGRKDSANNECIVSRLALGFNQLSLLPNAFVALTRLRYLTLRNNSFAAFPEVLARLPSLDVLDLSRNKIKSLPSQPGNLVNLRVLSLSRNRLTRLPSYLSDFRQLDILKVDHNPIEWPPKTVISANGNLDDPETMREWVSSLQNYMAGENVKNEQRKLADEVFINQINEYESNLSEGSPSWSKSRRDPHYLHSRNVSVDSNYSEIESATSRAPPSPSLPRPTPLHLGVAPRTHASRSPSRSPDLHYPANHDDHVSSVDEDQFSTVRKRNPTTRTVKEQQDQQLHARNASYAGGSRKTPRSGLSGKKSLPDLRTANLSQDMSRLPYLQGGQTTNNVSRRAVDAPLLSPRATRKDSGSSDGRSASKSREAIPPSPSLVVNRASQLMDVERNAYFKRLSVIPQSTLATNISPSLYAFVDGSRTLLFALSQIHQSLHHYASLSSEESFSALIRKTLDAAGLQLAQMISALDRFDAASTQTTPPPKIFRPVVETSRDTIVAYSTAVRTIQAHIIAVGSTEDPRYLRQLLLVLYGQTAEISTAWQTMQSNLTAVATLLSEGRKIGPPKSSQLRPFPTFGPNGFTSEPMSLNSPRQQSSSIGQTAIPRPNLMTHNRGGTSRRHAGSFSFKDVELGKQLPANDLTSGPRVPMRQGSAPVAPPSPALPSATVPFTAPLRSNAKFPHSRQGSQVSLLSSFPSANSLMPPQTAPVQWDQSGAHVERDIFEAAKNALDIAPKVWTILEDMLNDGSDFTESKPGMQESLKTAKIYTDRLLGSLQAQFTGTNNERRSFPHDAHAFIKHVVQLSNLVKSFNGSHPRFADLRARIASLAQATEDFAILLQSSSTAAHSPNLSTRSFSPMPGLGPPSPSLRPPISASVSDDGRLGANLSRSKSAASRQLLSPKDVSNGPRSAFAGQSFRVPSPVNYRS